MPINHQLFSGSRRVLIRSAKSPLALSLLLLLVTACGSGGAAEVNPSQLDAMLGPLALSTVRPTVPSKTLPVPAVTVIAPTDANGEPALESRESFDGQNAFEFLLAQMEFGPRWPGSPGHSATGDYIAEELKAAGWLVEEQVFDYQGVQARNIIGRVNEGKGPVVILGAHYDTRKIADRTPGSNQPVPGAVDGASGVAVLLELAQVLDIENIDREIWLAFFDVEDNGRGGMPGFEWAAGASYMAANLGVRPEAVIVVDMVGDADQQLFFERNSDVTLLSSLWELAEELGYADYFIPEWRHTLIDDHVPFLVQGIAAVDIIDFDYPYWHTIEDTADKASPDSLMRVGHVLQVWLESRLE